MTSHPHSSIDPGWFADPYDPSGFVLRWWDGTQWTAATHRADAGTAAETARAPREGARAYTIWIWAIVLLPVLSSASFFLIDFRSYIEAGMQAGTTGAGTGSPMPMIASPAYLLMTLFGWVLYGVTVVFAYLDHRSLVADGYPRPFHWAWAFLSSLVYVIGRSVLVKRAIGRGTAPMWAAIAVTVVSFVVIFGYVISVVVGVMQDSYSTTFSSAL